MPINNTGIALIKGHESLRLKAYYDPVGVLTVGFGHTSAAGQPQVTPGMTITKAEAETILRRDLAKFERAVLDAVSVPLNDNQFAALVSFCFNVGATNFRKSSVLRCVNDRQFDRVPSRLALWNKGGGRVLPGLVRRRKEEGELFMTPAARPAVESVTAAPTGPKHGKNLRKSRTIWGASAQATGAGGTAVTHAIGDNINETAQALSPITHLSMWLTGVFVAMILGGFALTTYARVDDAGLLKRDVE